MATLLAIETSGSSCSVALAINGEIIGLTDDTPRSHARKLLPMIEDLLASRGVKPKQLDGIAYSRGPGSFTGLRIGFGAVQGLAMGLDLPVWGVSTLLAMASKAANKYCLVFSGNYSCTGCSHG
jgi:universal bacterial protein YeaZ